jgi:hypothetical protein
LHWYLHELLRHPSLRHARLVCPAFFFFFFFLCLSAASQIRSVVY